MATLSKTFSLPVKSWRAAFSAKAIWPASAWRSEPFSAVSPVGRLHAVSSTEINMMPESMMPESQAAQDARRAMEVCNACRYCEGFCAVFPAMELHRDFAKADLSYLANLCHGCKGCYYACQYAPPHEFGINVPKSLGELRQESYGQYAWPKALSGAFERNGSSPPLPCRAVSPRFCF